MKKLISTVALLAITGNHLVAGGSFMPVIEPEIVVPVQEVVIADDDVKYNGFYLGAAVGNVRMNETVLSSGYAMTLMAGYYFNRYFGIEGRFTHILGDADVDNGPYIIAQDDILSNYGIYFKPMYALTTGFSLYGLAGYGTSTYEKSGTEYSESGLQWGLGAKYELANGLGIFADYLDVHSDDEYDGLVAEDILFNVINVGATYTF